MNWLWDNSYAKPATHTPGSTPAELPMARPETAPTERAPTDATTKKPWWRFWSREPTVDPNRVETMPPEDSNTSDAP
ncbi:MAG: hypothetical protein HQM00_02075 [Magnetococcales bacterium]|nr:hypothetical protein [Magnetococcales bacterium]